MSESEDSHHFRSTVVALTAFYQTASPDTQPTYNVPRRKRKNRLTKNSSVELVQNLSTDFSPQQLAENGDLEALKSFLEVFGITIKERDENQATLLHHATAANQVEVMKYLIESGIDLNATDKDGYTALHIAVLQGHIEATHLLLESGIDDTILDKKSDAALHIVARYTDTHLLSAFLEHPEVNLVVAGYRKRTPLHIIAEHDNVAAGSVIHNSVIVNEHFKKKTSFRLCAADEDDLTPIHFAARKGASKVLDLFMSSCMSHGYPPEVVLGFIDEENSTPLHAAIDGGFTEVVEVLLKHGADPVVEKDGQVPPFLLACSQGKFDIIDVILKSNNDITKNVVGCHDVYGQTCLHHCARSINSTHIMPFLVQKGAAVNSLDNKGQTPLMMAILAGNTCAVKALLELGADVFIKDNSGESALHHAVTRNRKKIVHILLELPCASKLVVDSDRENVCPIHLALKLGNCSLVTPMIATIRSQLKNIKDPNGNNYLHLAASGGNSSALTTLLEIPDCLKLLNETNVVGGTPLHSAAYHGHLRCTEILLAHGAVTHKCFAGHTPFMTACWQGHVEVARTLFNAHPFQLKWTNDSGRNPLHIAAAGNGNPQLITLLLDIDIPVTHDFKMESFFDILVQKNNVKGAIAAVEHCRFRECLDLVSPKHPHPMINQIIHMPEVAKKVLDRCHTKADVTRASPDYWESFNFKYLRLIDSPYGEEEEEQTKEEHSECAKARKAFQVQGVVEHEKVMHDHVVKYKGSINERQVMPHIKKKAGKLDHMKVLQTMVKYNRGSLLTHPVSSAYLKTKWRAYGRWIHIALSSLAFFQVLFLFLFTALIPSPSAVQANLNSTCDQSSSSGNNNTTTAAAGVCLEFSAGANVCRFITLAFAFANFLLWLFIIIQLRLEALNVVKNLYILVDGLSIAFTVFYLLPTKGLHNANWQPGAVAVFFAWFSLVLKIQLFDLFGVYVTMFLAITRRVFQVLLICFLFVISFGLSFYILTGNLTQYSTIAYSIFTNFGHMLGEIDYETFVDKDFEGNLNFHWLTFLFVVTLAILMAIVIMNLLIGLAVGDIEEIRSNAIAEKTAFEIDFFSKIDTILPMKLVLYLDRPSNRKYPNHKISFMRSVWKLFWQMLKGEDVILSNDDNFMEDGDGVSDQKSGSFSVLEAKVEELHMAQLNINQTLSQMKEVQDSMLKMLKNEQEEGSPAEF